MGKTVGETGLEVSRDSDKVTQPESGKAKTRTLSPQHVWICEDDLTKEKSLGDF